MLLISLNPYQRPQYRLRFLRRDSHEGPWRARKGAFVQLLLSLIANTRHRSYFFLTKMRALADRLQVRDFNVDVMKNKLSLAARMGESFRQA